MKIDRVIFCLNNNKTYTGFWNINSKIWSEKYSITPTLFYVGEQNEFEKLNLSKNHGDVFFLPNSKNDLTNGSKRNWTITWSLFYGATYFPNETCITSGIDQIPLGDHIAKFVEKYDDEKYLVCWSDAYSKNEVLFPSSHHVGKGKDFKEIYKISDDWEEELNKIYNKKNLYSTIAHDYWGIDEAYSSEIILRKRSEKVILVKDFFDDWSNRRIDYRKNGLGHDVNLLKDGYYSELHAPRPYESYQTAIDEIIFNCHNIRI